MARGLSQRDRLFNSVQKNLAYIPIQKQDLASAMGIMRRVPTVDQYPQAQLDGNREREAENAGQDVAVRGVK